MITPIVGRVVEKISSTTYLVDLPYSDKPKTIRLSAKYVMVGIELEVGSKVYVQAVDSSRMDGYFLTKVDFKGTDYSWEDGFYPVL
jgi:hypothetical protein